jgi:tetratricopeptide (TPR) repeat protein
VTRFLCSLLALLTFATPAGAELTNVTALAAAYDEILAGRFDVAERRLESACPPAPSEACLAMAAAAMWWRIALNPKDRSLDVAFERDAIAAIGAAERWTRLDPDRAEAWFYHAAAHAPLVQWRLLRGQRLTAIREASRVKSSLERALELDPALQDAHFGIGLYRYYAGIAPTALRMFRWLFWLPGGDREDGLRQMEQARRSGQLVTGEADYQLHLVYLWYEDQPERALELLETLHRRYPTNPMFLERIAEVQRNYLHDFPASLDAWRTLVDRAERKQIAADQIALARGRLGLAGILDAMWRTDQAIDVLGEVIGDRPVDPPDAVAQAYAQLGAAHARLGGQADAKSAFDAARRYTPEGDAGRAVRQLIEEETERFHDRRSAEAYRLSLDGVRALEQGAIDRAVQLLADALSMQPANQVVRYRYATALTVAKRGPEAVPLLENVVSAPQPPPAHVYASALFDLAVLVEASGDSARAIDLYRRARDTRGAARSVRDAADAAVDRLS